MCSQIVAEPGPPLKAKVSGRLLGVLAVERVGDEKHLGFDLAVAAFDGEPARGGGVLQRLAIQGNLMMRDDGRDFRHVVVEIFAVFVFIFVAGRFLVLGC